MYRFNRITLSVILILSVLLIATPLTFADRGAESDSSGLIKDLINKNDQLENRIKQLELKTSEKPQQPVPVYSPPPKEGGYLRAAEDIRVSGYLETSYNLNTVKPSSGNLNGINSDRAGVNALRSFDRNENSFTLNGFALFLEKQAPETGGIGFRTDLLYGEDAKLLNALTTGAASSASIDQNNVYIVQAYANLRLAYGRGIDLYFGKYASLYGFDTAYTAFNWLSSRGLIFNWGAPYTETGVRASYSWSDNFKTTLGVANGGNQDIDVNSGKSIEAKAEYKFNDRFNISQALYLGQDTPNDYGFGSGHHGQYNFILDSIAKLKVTDKWTIAGESLWGNAWAGQYYGFGIWNRYEFNNWIAFNNRTEYFSDSSNARLGALTNPPQTSGAAGDGDGYDAYESSFGLDFKVYKNLLTRLEYRVDWTPGAKRFDAESEYQSTFMGTLVYSF